MHGDVVVPPFLGCSGHGRRLLEADLWLSAGDTRSVLHKDADNAVNCVVAGRKRWLFFDPEQIGPRETVRFSRGHQPQPAHSPPPTFLLTVLCTDADIPPPRARIPMPSCLGGHPSLTSSSSGPPRTPHPAHASPPTGAPSLLDRPVRHVAQPSHTQGIPMVWEPDAEIGGTALSGSISTVLTVLSWICVGIHSRRALPSPVCA